MNAHRLRRVVLLVAGTLMLVLLGGKSRTLAEFQEMAARAALAIHGAGRLPSGRFIVECVPS